MPVSEKIVWAGIDLHNQRLPAKKMKRLKDKKATSFYQLLQRPARRRYGVSDDGITARPMIVRLPAIKHRAD